MNEQTAAAAWRTVELSVMAGIAHDMNGALAAVTLLAAQARVDGALSTDMLKLLDEQIERLNADVRLLIALQELERGSSQLHAPSEIAMRATSLFRRLPAGKNFSIDIAGVAAVGAVDVAAGTCVRALLLCLAAIAGAHKTGAVRLRFYQQVEWVVLHIGFAEEITPDAVLIEAARRMLTADSGAELEAGAELRLRLRAVE